MEIRSAVFGKGDEQRGTPGGHEMREAARGLARALARRGRVVVYGGGGGFPRLVASLAAEGGSKTVAIVPKRSRRVLADESASSLAGVVMPTELSSVGRSAPLARASNVRYLVNGGIGTLAELAASCFEPGVVAFLESSGGLANVARTKLWPFIGRPKHISMVYGTDGEALVEEAEQAANRLDFGRRQTAFSYTPKEIPGALTAAEKNRTVVSFLTADSRMSVEDRQELAALLEIAATSRLGGEVASKTMVLAYRDSDTAKNLAGWAAKAPTGVTQSVVRVRADGPSAGLSPKQATREKSAKSDSLARVADLGLGHSGAAEFGAYDAVVSDSDVVFISSLEYHNLAGLTHALRGSKAKVVAVLELPSTNADKIRPLLESIGEMRDKLVFAPTAKGLMKQVRAKMTAPTRASEWSYQVPSYAAAEPVRSTPVASPALEKRPTAQPETSGLVEKRTGTRLENILNAEATEKNTTAESAARPVPAKEPTPVETAHGQQFDLLRKIPSIHDVMDQMWPGARRTYDTRDIEAMQRNLYLGITEMLLAQDAQGLLEFPPQIYQALKQHRAERSLSTSWHSTLATLVRNVRPRFTATLDRSQFAQLIAPVRKGLAGSFSSDWSVRIYGQLTLEWVADLAVASGLDPQDPWIAQLRRGPQWVDGRGVGGYDYKATNVSGVSKTFATPIHAIAHMLSSD